jgi:hypothetical protein
VLRKGINLGPPQAGSRATTPGQGLPFKKLEAGAAARAHEADLVGVSTAIDRLDGIPAADDRECIAFSHGFCDGKGALWRIRQFRKCPSGRSRGRFLPRPRPACKARWSWDQYRRLPSRPQCRLPGPFVSPSVPALKSRALQTRLSTGRRNSTPLAFAFSRALLAVSTLSGSESEFPTLPPWASLKGVGHGAANEDAVRLVEQGIDDHDLVAHLGPAQDDHERAVPAFSVFSPRKVSSFSIRNPATQGLRNLVTPSVLAWARCAVPKASFT